MTGQYPWKDASDPLHLKDMVCNQEIDFSIIKIEKARDLLSRILEKDPTKRATIYELIEHPWITNDGLSPKKLELSNLNFGDLDRTHKKQMS